MKSLSLLAYGYVRSDEGCTNAKNFEIFNLHLNVQYFSWPKYAQSIFRTCTPIQRVKCDFEGHVPSHFQKSSPSTRQLEHLNYNKDDDILYKNGKDLDHLLYILYMLF